MSNNREKDIKDFAEVFAALANPNRLRIFLRLLDCCRPGVRFSAESCMETAACVGDLGQDLDIAASTVSHHIKELRRAGLIRTERRGQKTECWIDPETMATLQGFFS